MKTWSLVAASCALAAAGCGGIVVYEEGGSGGAGSSVASVTSVAASSSSGVVRCEDASDCAADEACDLRLGTCAARCSQDDLCASCGAGKICDPCGTSSCSGCDDCVAICVDASQGACDADDACPAGETCLFEQRRCVPTCENAVCADPNMVCNECGASSCCGCKDCVGVCSPLD